MVDNTVGKPRALTPGQIFVTELHATRNRKGWTQQQLADRLAELDVPIDRSTVAKIEASKRGVTLDELFYFAVALGVSPMALAIPRARDAFVRVVPNQEWGPWQATQWFRGILHPNSQYEAWGDNEKAVRFFYDARPDYEAHTVAEFPGLASMLQNVATAMKFVDEKRRPEGNGWTEATGGLELALACLEKIKEDLPAEIRRVKRAIQRSEAGSQE